MPAGRPSDYAEVYCERVLEWGAQGKSRAWMAAEIGVAKSTIQYWEKQHPEFSAAMERAKTLEQRWWEDEGQSGLRRQGYQSSMWSRSMAARFPDDWREKVALVGGDKSDEPIKQEISLGADAFTRAIAGLAARSGEGGSTG